MDDTLYRGFIHLKYARLNRDGTVTEHEAKEWVGPYQTQAPIKGMFTRIIQNRTRWGIVPGSLVIIEKKIQMTDQWRDI